MKTRKEAEARAMELFPPHLADNDFHGLTKRDLNEPYRKAFLKCWEEMQQNKQTCGFCVEPKEEQIGQFGQVNHQLLTVKQAESICLGFYNDLVGHLESGLSTELFHGEIVFNKHLEIIKLETTIQDNGLRKAAEKVILKWIDKCAITAEDIEKLQKALR